MFTYMDEATVELPSISAENLTKCSNALKLEFIRDPVVDFVS